jgi:hypothetical protein
MSQNDPGGFERNFLDSDVDLEIGHPSPGAEIYSRSSSFSLPSARSIGFFLIFTGMAVASTYYYAFQEGLAEGQRSLPPVVLAQNTPIKVPAEQVPGGVAPKADDLNIYGVMRGEPKATQVPARQSPADNAPGTIESLIAQSDPFGEALSGRGADETANNNLPAGNSIQVLQENARVKVTPPRPDLNRAPRAAVTSAAKPISKPVSKPAKKVVAKAPAPTLRAARQDYMVQLAAARSRALARGLYSRLQKSNNDMLGRRDPLILRVDLGDKGIFYRVNVPGFQNQNGAKQFCANLKKRGQDCLVRKQP